MTNNTTLRTRPRRSVLYMPASNARAMDKARTLEADAVIFDLEDAVSPAAKVQARQQACDQVRAGGYGRREVLIRINAPGTPWSAQDLAAACAARPDGLVVPKVSGPDTIRTCREQMSAQGVALPLWAMIETPEAVSRVDAIAAEPGVAVLVMGTSDLLKELRAPDTPDRLALQYALSRTVYAARRYGLDALDGVSPALDEADAFTALCRQGRAFGFDGKTLIHPAQIAPANTVFGHGAHDVEQARRLVQAWEDAERRGLGIAVLDGRMIEGLHAQSARRILAFEAALRAP